MAVRTGPAALLAMTLMLVAHPAGRTSRTATRVLCAIPVASAALSIVAVVSGSPDLLAFILLLGCTAAILALTRAQVRRLSRHMKAAQDNLRRARLNRQQRRRTPPGSLPPAQAAGRPQARPGPR